MLPHSYFVNDHRQLYPRPFAHVATRKEHGLRDEGVIFGNFGQLYKVEPKLFDVWAKIVRATPNATLWLLKFPKEAVTRLEQQASARGLGAEQMVLSSLLPIDTHVASKALCDVALDTAMFNGHTTGADTLWTGSPLVSMPGVQMRSRAGASMAFALGVTSFLARSLDDYQQIAQRLGSSRRRLQHARRRLESAIDTSPLFDTALWAKVQPASVDASFSILTCSLLCMPVCVPLPARVCQQRLLCAVYLPWPCNLNGTWHCVSVVRRRSSVHGLRCGTRLWLLAQSIQCTS